MNGYILYTGPSQIDGAPIVAIATMQSSNRKTGAMIQAWILRSDMKPTEAVRSGADISICGDCIHRGIDGNGRSCYVNVGQAPQSVWRTWNRGGYESLKDYRVFSGRSFRFGAYGDPAAVPLHVWLPVLPVVTGWTGYTHQWRNCDTAYRLFLMASVDSVDDYLDAKELGYRTFRVMAEGESPHNAEIYCPATPEGGSRRQCITCKACAGTRQREMNTSRDVAIVVHGSGKKHFTLQETE